MKRLIILLILKLRNVRNHVGFNSSNDLALKCKFEGYNKIGKNTKYCGDMGRCSYMGRNCTINADIGRYTSIGSNVNVIYHTHPLDSFVSTSPSFFNPTGIQNGKSYVDDFKFDEYMYADRAEKIAVHIGSDVWIGYGVTIMGGVNIADGAVIASGAVVTRDVEPYTIVGGVPAKKIKDRFTVEQTAFLLDLKWWNKDSEWVEQNAHLFDDIDKLMAESGDK